MFDNYVLSDGGFKNVEKDEKIIGYELRTRITYYRGIPLSMIEDIQLKVDGVEVAREKIRFSPDGETFFTLDEMWTVTSYKWEYGQEGVIFVVQDGGLPEGKHEITLTQGVRVSYIPVPFFGTNTKVLEII
jgi:Domain of unknown function (DUF6379)